MTMDPWPIIWPDGEPVGATDELIDAAVSAATTLLWTRTGRRLGLRTAVEQYSVPAHRCPVPYGDRCVGVHLVNIPVAEVVTVKIDGVPLASSEWTYDGVTLSRIDACWPAQIEVTYRWGVSLDEGSPLHGLASLAMGEVAVETLNAMRGKACKLPSRAVTVTRAGVTMELGDASTIAKEGMLGLPLADQLILAVNPGRRRARARVYSPDMARRTRAIAP